MYDLIIRNAYVIDPSSKTQDFYDIAIEDGKIAEILKRGKIARSKEILDADGLYLCPGLVDLHVHLTRQFAGPHGYKMLAQAGVTTAIDFAGPVEEIINDINTYNYGLNIGCCNAVTSDGKRQNINPSRKILDEFIKQSMKKGAIGIKILGGHFPLTPEATRCAFEICNKERIFVAYHAGTTNSSSNLEGVRETVELAVGLKVFLAHMNAYCRGMVNEPILEVKEAIQILLGNENIIPESHLAHINATTAICQGEEVLDQVTKNCLKMGRYEPDRKGLYKAIQEGYAFVHVIEDGKIVLESGEVGLRYWESKETNTGVSFPVNRRDTAFLFATSRKANGKLVLNNISTDGGGIPRNNLLSMGLCLVKFKALSIQEFVNQISTAPAKTIGLKNKGKIEVGADADITIFDYEKQKAVHAITNGKYSLYQGAPVKGEGVMLITQRADKKFLQNDVNVEITYPETLYIQN